MVNNNLVMMLPTMTTKVLNLFSLTNKTIKRSGQLITIYKIQISHGHNQIKHVTENGHNHLGTEILITDSQTSHGTMTKDSYGLSYCVTRGGYDHNSSSLSSACPLHGQECIDMNGLCMWNRQDRYHSAQQLDGSKRREKTSTSLGQGQRQTNKRKQKRQPPSQNPSPTPQRTQAFKKEVPQRLIVLGTRMDNIKGIVTGSTAGMGVKALESYTTVSRVDKMTGPYSQEWLKQPIYTTEDYWRA